MKIDNFFAELKRRHVYPARQKFKSAFSFP